MHDAVSRPDEKVIGGRPSAETSYTSIWIANRDFMLPNGLERPFICHARNPISGGHLHLRELVSQVAVDVIPVVTSTRLGQPERRQQHVDNTAAFAVDNSALVGPVFNVLREESDERRGILERTGVVIAFLNEFDKFGIARCQSILRQSVHRVAVVMKMERRTELGFRASRDRIPVPSEKPAFSVEYFGVVLQVTREFFREFQGNFGTCGVIKLRYALKCPSLKCSSPPGRYCCRIVGEVAETVFVNRGLKRTPNSALAQLFPHGILGD